MRERESTRMHMCKQGRGRDRGRPRIPSGLCADSTEPDGLQLTNREIMTWADVRFLTDWATQVPPQLIFSKNVVVTDRICWRNPYLWRGYASSRQRQALFSNAFSSYAFLFVLWKISSCCLPFGPRFEEGCCWCQSPLPPHSHCLVNAKNTEDCQDLGILQFATQISLLLSSFISFLQEESSKQWSVLQLLPKYWDRSGILKGFINFLSIS